MAVLAEAADSREWQDVLRISEDLRQAVCRIHAKLASERELLLAERAAAAAEKAAAAAEREQAERLVRMISAAADRCNALTGAKEATQPSGRAMPGPSTAAPKGVVVKQPPQRPAQSTQSHAAPTNGSYPLAPPMPSRSPPPASTQSQAESTEVPGAVLRVKAPPNQGRRAASSVPAVAPEASKETGDSARTACSVKVQSQEWGPTGSSSGLLATPLCKENDAVREETSEAPAQDTPKRSKSSKDEAVTEEAAAVASNNESCNGTRVEPLLDDLEDEMDEHELWAMNAPSPPSKAHPTESSHYRVMPPPRADPLPTDPFPDSDELETGRSLSPEEDREYAEEAFESEERGAEDSVSSVPVKAMPGRDGPSSSAWPVGKAAASRYKAPPAALFGSSASSSDRRETGSKAQPAASSVATPEASAGLTTSSVKAPPHRSTSG